MRRGSILDTDTPSHLDPSQAREPLRLSRVHAEDRRVSASAEWQGGQEDGCEARILRQRPQAVFKALVRGLLCLSESGQSNSKTGDSAGENGFARSHNSFILSELYMFRDSQRASFHCRWLIEDWRLEYPPSAIENRPSAILLDREDLPASEAREEGLDTTAGD